MILLSAADTEAVADWGEVIACLREAYAADAAPKAIPGRLVAVDKSAWLRCMPAIPPTGRYMGSKQIFRTRDGKLNYLIVLFDKTEGRIAFMIDALAITAMRTAATSAVALDLLSDTRPMCLAVLGSGLEATHHVEAFARLRGIEQLRVYSPTAANRRKFADMFGELLEVDARAANTPEEAVSGATHVLCAARSRGEQPILYGDWLAAGTVVVSVGSTHPTQREIDVSVVRRCDLIVADVPDEMVHDTGDMMIAAAEGVSFRDKLFALSDLVQGRIPPALRTPDKVRMFKSVGSALQDIACAEHIAERAVERGLGTEIDFEFELKQSIGRNA
jgi:alanine dehydrogenase